jgi:hypothetical protein
MAMITDYVPGAYMTHDMLHMRGGHQLNWQIDGVEIPNTNIASNLAAQIDPKDIDYIEVQRGSYTADTGDRTYGVFNVVPRTGFERDRQAELVLNAGNFLQTNDQLNLGDHTQKFAWYTSLSGNRSNLGFAAPHLAGRQRRGERLRRLRFVHLQPHPQTSFASSHRRASDYYQIPKDPNVNDFENLSTTPAACATASTRPTATPPLAGSTPSIRPPSAALALLPLQPGRLRLQPKRQASLHHRNRRPRTTPACRPPSPLSSPGTPSQAGIYSFTSTRTTSSAPSSTTAAAPLSP